MWPPPPFCGSFGPLCTLQVTVLERSGNVCLVPRWLYGVGAVCGGAFVWQATGFTPLCLAVHKVQPDLVRALNRGRANANHVPRDGLPPLCVAAAEGHKAICESLIQGGAAVDFTTPVRC